MTAVYPVSLTPVEDGCYMVDVPDLDIITEGKDLSDAIAMARDAICLKAVTLQDLGREVPPPSDVGKLRRKKGSILSLVDCDFDGYRSYLDNRSVKKNCTLPAWLERKASAANINFSGALQSALMEQLHIAH
ncbi:MAG: type II toxin-antitoxin system HicB family antitoxin [Oscillospiraceae bacterium]|nr:type II toxin-antitoxin system HicB family antitoxin [Oscillospiraceae bacterium]